MRLPQERSRATNLGFSNPQAIFTIGVPEAAVFTIGVPVTTAVVPAGTTSGGFAAGAGAETPNKAFIAKFCAIVFWNAVAILDCASFEHFQKPIRFAYENPRPIHTSSSQSKLKEIRFTMNRTAQRRHQM